MIKKIEKIIKTVEDFLIGKGIEKKINLKIFLGKIVCYLLIVSFFYQNKNISEAIMSFVLSYIITNVFIFFSSKIKEIKKIKENKILNCVFNITIGINILLMRYFYLKQRYDIFFSYSFFLIILVAFMIPYIKEKPFRILEIDSEKKLILISYVVYTTILVAIKCTFNNLLGRPIKDIIHIDVSYIEYQLIVCTVYLDRLKDMYSLTLIGGSKEDIEKFEEIVEKNKDNPKLNYKVNKELMKYWEKYLEEDDSKLENVIKILSEINQEFFQCEKRKLDEKVDRLLSKDSSILNKSQKEDLKRIIKRKIKKDEILVLEFVLYKTDIEKIIGKVDD